MWRAALSVAVVVLALAAAPGREALGQAAHGPGWIVDRAGCRVWNPVFDPKRSFSWSGACANGYAGGEGVLQWYENGLPTDRYEGSYRGGKMDGHGLYVWANGARHDGEWKENGRSGHGVYVTANGDRYEGDFTQALLNGRGAAVLANGDRYEGGFWNYRPNGKGTLRRPDGEVFAGEWVNGCFKSATRRYAVGLEVSECH